MFLLGITRATNLDGREISFFNSFEVSINLSSTNSESSSLPKRLLKYSLCNSPRPLEVYRP